MENAVKALQIASSVLLSVLVLGLLVFSYNKLAANKKVEEDTIRESQVSEFNKQFEGYNRNLYGSEVVSLSNMVDNFNYKYSTEEGYENIVFNFTGITQSEYPYYGNSSLGSLSNRHKELERKIADYSNSTYVYNGVTYTYSQLEKLNAVVLTSIGIVSGTSYEIKLNAYREILNEQKKFLRLEFKNVKFTYDNDTGRLKEIDVKPV